MPCFIKNASSWVELPKDSILFMLSSQLRSPKKGSIKINGEWRKIWADGTSGNAWPSSPLEPGVPRWGRAQYSGANLQGQEITEANEGYNSYGNQIINWSGAQEFIDTNLIHGGLTIAPEDAPEGDQFMYFAVRKSDVTSSDPRIDFAPGNGFPVTFDGIKWPPDTYQAPSEEQTGPVEVMYDDGDGPEAWYVYRADYAASINAGDTYTAQV